MTEDFTAGFAGLRAGILANVTKPQAVEALVELMGEMNARSLPYMLDCASALSLGRPGEGLAISEMKAQADYLIVIGGDGTILSAVRDFEDRALPILGINPGLSYGFLAEIGRGEISEALDTMLKGEAKVEKKAALCLSYLQDGIERRATALNDLVFARGQEARLVELEIRVDGEYFADYAADGLVFSTISGSTAYNLAAGGPVLYPGLEAFVMTPICPHALMNRPVVFPKTTRISLINARPEREIYVSADGRSLLALGPQEVTLGIGPLISFINVGLRSFPCKLREKTGWKGSLK